MLRFLFLGVFLISGLHTFAQKSVNDYKYIIVPKSFEFLAKEDAYQLNSLTKFLFNKNGFNAFIQGQEMPDDLKENICKGLLVNVKKNSSLFVSKLVIELSDCRANIIFSSSEGTSREKDFKKAYHEALRNAFKDVERLNYKYNEEANGKSAEETEVVSQPNNQEKVISEEEEKDTDTKVEAKKPKKEIIPTTSKGSLLYTLNNTSFVFKNQEYGYELFKNQEEELVSLGKIYKLKRENSYLITAGDLSGSGYFDNFGNFVLERVNPVTNKIILDTFARQ